jgi:hypothetical protein
MLSYYRNLYILNQISRTNFNIGNSAKWRTCLEHSALRYKEQFLLFMMVTCRFYQSNKFYLCDLQNRFHYHDYCENVFIVATIPTLLNWRKEKKR